MSVQVGNTGHPDDKVVLVGNPAVGKSTIFQFFKSGKFMPADQLSHRDKAEHSKQWTVSTGERRSVSQTYIPSDGAILYKVLVVR